MCSWLSYLCASPTLQCLPSSTCSSPGDWTWGLLIFSLSYPPRPRPFLEQGLSESLTFGGCTQYCDPPVSDPQSAGTAGVRHQCLSLQKFLTCSVCRTTLSREQVNNGENFLHYLVFMHCYSLKLSFSHSALSEYGCCPRCYPGNIERHKGTLSNIIVCIVGPSVEDSLIDRCVCDILFPRHSFQLVSRCLSKPHVVIGGVLQNCLDLECVTVWLRVWCWD